ncbi:CRS1 protein [Candidatus Electrothrix aarhusensis]|uniref:CRS1 protein n=1 Tax=Candidatus Electrothrix aarhusensis TaxID=1859131 RepID=A0A3S3R639_9BACT|nr:CRS1 protein [Candidatus Electrothrix aarhusensis]
MKTETKPEKKEKKKPQITLNSKQRKYLRGLGHHVDPIVYVGKEGLTANVNQSVLDTLRTRELIKVKLGQNCEVPKKEAAELLAKASGAAWCSLSARWCCCTCLIRSWIGNSVLFCQNRAQKREIEERVL